MISSKGDLAMRSYGAARGYFSLLGFLAWCQIFGGGFIAFAAVGIASELSRFSGPPSVVTISIAAMPGVLICLFGLFGLAMVQNGRATVDMAELTQQMLKVARDQLEVSQQALQKGGSAAQSFEAIAAATDIAGGGGHRSAKASEWAEASDDNQQPALETSEVTRGARGLLTYNGQTIAKAGGSYLVDGIAFASLDAAKKHIDKNPLLNSE